MKLRLCFRFILIIAPIVAVSATKLNAQIPEAKTKPTGSVSGRVTIGEKPAPGILVVVGNGNSGRVATAEGQNLPPALKIYLVPAERESAENVLRFFEGSTAGDGTFAIGNIAPGRYWIIAQPGEAADTTRRSPSRAMARCERKCCATPKG